MKSAVVLISGRGSNMRSLVEARPGVEMRAVLSNRPDAGGIAWAREQGLATEVVDHRRHASRERFDAAMAEAVDRHSPDLILLAGFMRILTPVFIDRYPRRILNIHPSLLPAFPGLHTHRQALEAGVKLHGCTVHVVTSALDAGPIVAQAAVAVLPDDSEASLAARVLAAEHRVYPAAVRWFAEGRARFDERGAVVVDGAATAAEPFFSPRDAA